MRAEALVRSSWGDKAEVVSVASRYGLATILLRASQTGMLVFWVSLMACAEKGLALIAVVASLIVYFCLMFEAAARSDGAAAEGAAADAGALEAEAPARDEEPQHPLLRLASRLLAFLGFGFDEFEPWLKWKVYDVLFALLLVLLGRRLRHPVVQRALEFVGEA